MEGNVQRRLNCVSRHLLSPPDVDNLTLYPVLVKGEQAKYEEGDPVVIGGMVLDIHATPSMPPCPRTTIPGKVQYALGGVARNIAECMSKLGTKPYMISALGLDIAGNLLLEYWNSAGLSTEGIRKHQDTRTAVITSTFDTHGEVVVGVADVEAVEKFLTPEWILQFKGNISSASALLVDANLNPPALEAACQVAAEYNIPVWFEPVSVAKSIRIASVVNKVTFVSPNEDELIAMANALSIGSMFHPIERDNIKSTESLFQMLKPAISVLLDKGVKIVVATLGANGVFLCSKDPNCMSSSWERAKRNGFSRWLYDTVASSCSSSKVSVAMQGEGHSCLFAAHFPALPASVVRLTGAGDNMVGGILASLCSGLDIMQSVAVGVAVAKAAIETETNVPSTFSLASIADDAKWGYAAAKVMVHRSML
ncbi:hypothetical protein JCGZ_10068 [Jatropha curcas]|uniref:Carbohydrate kinase PfkB domain-containing protein n=1 Tax=Jatropha curcas TaxID=180498 RepID=A0A067LG30_JATCU|nr:pseudouridine kinase [Jatropha curcas]KDP46228.1 hypothetical protein JCGZ_10068 [Jatropha curcas]